MIRTHISIPEDIDKVIKDYCIKNDIKYSQAVSKLVELGTNNKEISELVNTNNNLMKKIYSRLAYSINLLEQFYSDMEIDELTNPNLNPALRDFRSKKNKYDD